MRDLYLENERLKGIVERGRNRIKILSERIEEYEKARLREGRYAVEIPDEEFAKKANDLKKHCIYQKHFCDGTPNFSQTREEDKLPICPKYSACGLRKKSVIPQLDKTKKI